MAGFPSTNTLVQIESALTPSSFVTIAEVGDIDGLKLSGNMHDTSTHSLGTPWMTQIIGLLKNQGLSFPINRDPTDATQTFSAPTGLGYIFKNRILKRYRLVPGAFPMNAFEFDAYVSQYSEKSPVDGVYRADVTLSATGEPDFDVDAT